MAGKDAQFATTRAGKWKVRLSLAMGAAAVLGCCVILHYTWGPGAASAQAPYRSVATPQTTAPTRTVAATGTSKIAAAQATATGGANTENGTTAIDTRKLTVMAVVNGQQVTRQDLARECLRRYGSEVLESMVNKHLILHACQQRGITITERDVADEISRMAAKFGLSTDRWLQMLDQERNIKPEQYSRDIVWPTLALRQLAAKQIEVTPAEIRRAFESELGPKVKVRLISVSSGQKAEQLRAMCLAKPAQFGDLAKNHSEDTNSAAVGGFIPPIRMHIGDPQVEQVAFSLKQNEISPVIHIANQYLILKCEEHIGPTVITPAQRRDAEARIVEYLREQKMRTVASDLFKQLQTEAKVVNIFNDAKLRTQMPGVAATIDGQQISVLQLSEECIVRHGKDVLEGEINRQLLMQELSRRSATVAESDIDAEIARAAESYGYLKKDGAADVEAWLKTVTEQDGATVELYVRDAVWPTVALKKLVSDKIEVTQEDLRKGFEANYGERAEVQAVVLGSHRQANEVFEMARNNNSEIFFGQLAEQYSVEPLSRANGGKVPPIQRHSGQPMIEEAAFKLKDGDLSEIVVVADKYVILRGLGRTKPVVKDFNAVKDELYNDIQEKKLRLAMAQKFDDLKERAQIDNFLAGTSQSGKTAASRTRFSDHSAPINSPTPRSGATTATRPTSAPVRR
jgi:parvulin-like peptidyl-prolyl isomerase